MPLRVVCQELHAKQINKSIFTEAVILDGLYQ